MASNNTTIKSASSKRPTAEEMRKLYEGSQKRIKQFEDASEALKKLTDISKNTTRNIQSFNKESLISYLQNIGSNEKNLRNLSWYLYYRSQVYRRRVNYNARMFDLQSHITIPEHNLVKGDDDAKILKSFYDTNVLLDKMDLDGEFLKVYIICFIQDVFYGCKYLDDTGLFILPLNPDYCKIAGRYNTGDFAFAMDMSYFRGSNEYLLEYWGEPFQSMYNTYDKEGNSARWQIFPDEYAVCLKQGIEDWQTIVPPFSGLFAELINLEDVKDVQAVADAQDIYKMIWLELDTLSGAKDADEWAVDPSIVIDYFNRMVNEALPDYTTAAIVPGKLNTITFDNDKTTDTNKVATSTKTVLNSAGGAQILNSESITGTTGYKFAVMADTREAISSLLPQTEGWINRILPYTISNPSYVKFFRVSWYTKDDYRANLLTDAQYSLSTKLSIMALDGFSALEALSLNHLEEDILGLHDKFKYPLTSSFTISSNAVANGETDPQNGGRPASSDGDLTDDGEASREKADNGNQ